MKEINGKTYGIYRAVFIAVSESADIYREFGIESECDQFIERYRPICRSLKKRTDLDHLKEDQESTIFDILSTPTGPVNPTR